MQNASYIEGAIHFAVCAYADAMFNVCFILECVFGDMRHRDSTPRMKKSI